MISFIIIFLGVLCFTINLYYILLINSYEYNALDERTLDCYYSEYGCCKIYDSCNYMKSTTYDMNYLTYYIEHSKDSDNGKNCPILADLFRNYNEETFKDSKDTFTCKLDCRCDVGVRNTFSYKIFNETIQHNYSEFDIYTKDKNCPSKFDIITQYNVNVHHKNDNVYIYISLGITITIVILLCISFKKPKYSNLNNDLP